MLRLPTFVPRLRLGVGRGKDEARKPQMVQHVLSAFDKNDEDLVSEVVAAACQQITCWLDEGIQQAMNRFNGSVKR